jgi:tripartite ATP-independent transporter DctP family solute receptor
MSKLKRNVGVYFALAALLVFGLAFTAKPLHAAGPLQMRISLVNLPPDILVEGAEWMGKKITEYSNGSIVPKVYHSGVLSGTNGAAEIEMTQQGTIQLEITSSAYLDSMVPQTSVVSLPFMFKSLDQEIAFADAKPPILDEIGKRLETKNLKVIAWWPRGFRQLTNSRQPVRNLQDLKDMRIRVQTSKIYTDVMNALGAKPVPMAIGEVYNALQLKTIDGQENAETVIFANKYMEVQKYLSIWDYATDFEVVMVNLPWWNKLTPEQRAVLERVAKESVQFEAGLVKKDVKERREYLTTKGGMQMNVVDAQAREAMKRAVEPVWRDYTKIYGQKFVDDFKTAVNKY